MASTSVVSQTVRRSVAFDQKSSGHEDAVEAFRALERSWPDDRLVQLHTRRLAAGQRGEVATSSCSNTNESASAARSQRGWTDPAQHRRLEKLNNQTIAGATFELVARELHATKGWAWGARYFERWIERMEKDLFPWIGSLPLAEITAPLLLQTLRCIEVRGANKTAQTLRRTSGQVFRYGVAIGRCERNSALDLRGALWPITVKHMAAVLEPSGVGALMRAIAEYTGQPLTRAALELSALLFQRPGNIRQMEWSEGDLDGGLWRIPAVKMKRTVQGKLSGRPHFVPLANRAVKVLREVYPITGHGRYVFPSLLTGERPMSENTARTALRRMGYTNDDMTPHGFRATALTILVEHLNVHPDVIKAQLAHGKSGPLGAAYDRAEFPAQRRLVMDDWSAYLTHLQVGGPRALSASLNEFEASFRTPSPNVLATGPERSKHRLRQGAWTIIGEHARDVG